MVSCGVFFLFFFLPAEAALACPVENIVLFFSLLRPRALLLACLAENIVLFFSLLCLNTLVTAPAGHLLLCLRHLTPYWRESIISTFRRYLRPPGTCSVPAKAQ